MIDELNLIREILGDLTGIGIWGFIAFLAYGIIKIILTWGSLLYIINKAVVLVFDHIKAPVTKSEHDEMRRKYDNLMSDTIAIKAAGSAKETTLTAEIERVKSMYKILKEANSVGTE